MIVQLKLMGMLKDKSPENGQIQVPDHGTITTVLEALDIPLDSVQVFTLNGALERDKSRVLSADDELTILPPVGGG